MSLCNSCYYFKAKEYPIRRGTKFIQYICTYNGKIKRRVVMGKDWSTVAFDYTVNKCDHFIRTVLFLHDFM